MMSLHARVKSKFSRCNSKACWDIVQVSHFQASDSLPSVAVVSSDSLRSVAVVSRNKCKTHGLGLSSSTLAGCHTPQMRRWNTRMCCAADPAQPQAHAPLFRLVQRHKHIDSFHALYTPLARFNYRLRCSRLCAKYGCRCLNCVAQSTPRFPVSFNKNLSYR